MASESLILVVNPGSSSRKYGLFINGKKSATINFEFEDNKVIGKIEYAGEKHSTAYDDADLSAVSQYILPLLHEHKVICGDDIIDTIGIRVVAPTMRFTNDELITDETITALEAVQQKAPLHVTTVLSEIKQIKTFFAEIPIVAVSDTAFHKTKPEWAWNYGIDIEMAEKFGIKRYGYHGISVGSVVWHLKDNKTLFPKTIVCHVGSGSSITAVENGKSVDTTMGYSPLEGLIMASRCGNIDVSAALAIKRELHLTDDGLEQYLNKQSGLLGISGSSNDIRQLRVSEEQGDERAKLALKMFVYRIQQAIGQMVASMGGVDCIVFTATVTERSSVLRERILNDLEYLGFIYDPELDTQIFEPSGIVNVGIPTSKPILIISTDESAEIARRAAQYMHDQK